MLKSYLLIFLRNFKRHVGSSMINIASLAVGMAACMLLWQYILHERSYDDFHQKADHLYRLIFDAYEDGKLSIKMGRTPCAMGPMLKETYPEIVEFARLFNQYDGIASYKNRKFIVEKAYCTDASFLEMFTFPLITGNPKTALRGPSGAVISESLAKKLFGKEEPMGKTFRFHWGEIYDYIVTGVFKDVPENSHETFDILFPIHHVVEGAYFKDNWTHFNFRLYVLLRPDVDRIALEAKFPEFVDKYFGEELRKNNEELIYFLQPLRDIYLHSNNFVWETKKRGNLNVIYFLTIVSMFVLVIAWANYINLSTASSMDRAREVGLRKVVGAHRGQLIRQFLCEPFLLNILAAVIAVVILKISNPYFNQLLGIDLSLEILIKSSFWLVLLLIFFGGALLAGVYPAFVLSAFKPINVLKGRSTHSWGGIILRKGLVVFQFIISIALIASTLVIYNQIAFMRSGDLGMNVDQIVIIRTPQGRSRIENFLQKEEIFLAELLKHQAIGKVTAGNTPGKEYFSMHTVRRKKKDGKIITRSSECGWVDYRFFDTYQIKLITGRNFSKNYSTDRGAVILNEKAVEHLEFESPEKALNQIIVDDSIPLVIIGVIRNYNQVSLKNPIKPVIFRLPDHSGSSYYSVKLNDKKKHGQVLTFIEEKFHQMFPGNPFIYFFMDSFFDRQYASERRFMRTFGGFAFLAIVVACVGLFGLTSYLTLQRAKEIGIRKVFGANFSNILVLLSKDFIKLLFYAILIGLPVTYFIFNKWLENYSYRLNIGWWFFVIPVLIVLPLVLLAVAYHLVIAALEKPIQPLRYE